MRDTSLQAKASILLVDDHGPNLVALESILAVLDQDLVKVTSGEQALRHLLARDFAVILLDVRMQGLDGFETAKFIRQRDRSRHTPIIFLTAHESPVFPVGKAYELGAVDFLVKPLVPDILRAKVAVFVDLFRKTEEIKRQAQRLLEMEERDYQRKLAEESLRQSEERFRLMADSAPALLWMAGPDGLCSFVNRPWLEFTGRTLEQEMGNGWTEGLMPEDSQRCLEQYRSAVLAQKPFSIEFRLRRADGEYRWVLGTGAPRFHPDGSFAGFIGSTVDITEHRRLEEQLLQAQKMEAIGRLAGGIAHDFNNLMTVVLGYSDMLSATLAKDDQARTQVESIQAAGERAAALTRQLLAFSRKQMLAPKTLDLNGIVAGMKEMLRRLIPENIELNVQLGSVGPVQADPTQVEQVILNLAVNARDAMPRGGRLTIQTSAFHQDDCQDPEVRPGPYTMVTVRDTGCGMDAATRSHLFEPFFTTKGVGKGTGLGLATVYGIVKQSGGVISVWSESGRGTEVSVRFPCVEVLSSPLPSKETSTTGHGTECVLLVEDEECIRGLARRVLERNGYRVLEASHGAQAMEIGESQKDAIDLLVTDVIMPGMSGRDLADRLRQQRPGLKVLFMSGYNEEVLQGPTGMAFLQKPFLPNALASRIRQLLDFDNRR